MKQLNSWHHLVYDDIEFWDDQRVIDTYYRLSLDLRIREVDGPDHFDRMGQVELELRARNLDPDHLADAVQAEFDELKGSLHDDHSIGVQP